MPSKRALIGFAVACTVIASFGLLWRGAARRTEATGPRPPPLRLEVTPDELAAEDAMLLLGHEPLGDERSALTESDGPSREVPMGLDPATMGVESEREHYDAVPVDELASEWLRRAVQSGRWRSGKP